MKLRIPYTKRLQMYEAKKRALQKQALTSTEYEKAIRIIAARYRV